MQAIPGVLAGSAAEKEGAYNQAVLNQNALSAERDGAADVERVRYNVRQAIGQQLVAQGGTGFEMGAGSALDAVTESQVNGIMDAMNVRRQAESKAQALRLQGTQVKMQANDTAKGAYFGAAAAVMKAAADYAGGGGG
jgi:hypothetical protein